MTSRSSATDGQGQGTATAQNRDEVGIAPGQKIAGRYLAVESVGKGGSCVVWKCNDEKDIGREKAVKILRKSVPKEVYEAESGVHNSLGSHRNIIKFYEADDDPEVGRYLVFELLKGPLLCDVLKDRKKHGVGPFSQEESKTAMRCLINGLDFLHDSGIIHRDIKPENLQYKDKNDENSLVIIDFGLSVTVKLGESRDFKDCHGTAEYFAPELAQDIDASKIRQTHATDLWAAGMTWRAMLNGGFNQYKIPTENPDDREKRRKRRRKCIERVRTEPVNLDEGKFLSEDGKNLLEMLFQSDPKKRITAKDAKKHPARGRPAMNLVRLTEAMLSRVSKS